MQSRHVACGVLSFVLLAAQLSAQEPGPAPEGLIAKSTSPTAVRLTWTMAPGAATFTVYRGASADGPFQPIGTVKQYATLGKPTAGQEPIVRPLNFLDAGATPQSTLYYRVTALSDFENPGTSETVSVTTPAQPVTPANFGVETYGGGTILDFRWSPVAGASYKILRDAGKGFVEVPGMQYANNSWARDYNTVTVGQTYLYKLVATYPDGRSAESQVLRVVIASKPPGVSNLRATSPGPGTVVLSWGPAPSAESYGILRGKGNEPMDWIKVAGTSTPLRLPGNTSSYTDTNLWNNATYRYTVTTSYGPNRSGETAGVSVTTAP